MPEEYILEDTWAPRWSPNANFHDIPKGKCMFCKSQAELEDNWYSSYGKARIVGIHLEQSIHFCWNFGSMYMDLLHILQVVRVLVRKR